jgi:hypothetical protein
MTPAINGANRPVASSDSRNCLAQMAADSQRGRSQAAAAQKDLSPEQIAKLADDITGQGMAADIAVALAQKAETLTPNDNAALVSAVSSKVELRSQDFVHARDAGRITQSEMSAVANGFVLGSNQGRMSTDPDTLAISPIDTMLSMNLYGSKESVDANVTFLKSADSAQVQPFMRSVGYETLNYLAQSSDLPTIVGGEVALRTMGQLSDPKTLAEVYAGFSPEQRQSILQGLASKDGGAFGEDNPDMQHDALATLINAVGSQTGSANAGPTIDMGGKAIYTNPPQYDDLAVEIAKFAETSDDGVFFDGAKPRDARAEAVGTLFNRHSQAILDTLTDHALTGEEGSPVEDQIDKIQLANTMRLTALNPDFSGNATSMQQLQTYGDAQARVANDPKASAAAKKQAESRAEALVRAQVLVPAQVFASGVEQGEASGDLYKFAVTGAAKLLNYGASKIPVPGVDKLAGYAIKSGAKAVKADIDESAWKDLDPFLTELDKEVNSYKSADAAISSFGLLDDVQMEISDIRQATGARDEDVFLHSRDVPGQ